MTCNRCGGPLGSGREKYRAKYCINCNHEMCHEYAAQVHRRAGVREERPTGYPRYVMEQILATQVWGIGHRKRGVVKIAQDLCSLEYKWPSIVLK